MIVTNITRFYEKLMPILTVTPFEDKTFQFELSFFNLALTHFWEDICKVLHIICNKILKVILSTILVLLRLIKLGTI